jgi:hypothetical protein
MITRIANVKKKFRDLFIVAPFVDLEQEPGLFADFQSASGTGTRPIL